MQAQAVRIKFAANSETWRVSEDTRVRYVRIWFDEDADAVLVEHAYNKDPWISDGERFDSFAEARRINGLPSTDDAPPRELRPTIYIASRVKHAASWRALRDGNGANIISTWIDEDGPGQTSDRGELVRRCLREAAEADVCILYVGTNDAPLKLALGEACVALHAGKPVVVAFGGEPTDEMIRATGGLVHGGSWAPGVSTVQGGVVGALNMISALGIGLGTSPG